MENKHLPYNILLVIALFAIGLMAICSFGLRQSEFAVRVGYELPQPQIAPAESSVQPDPPRQVRVVPVPSEQKAPPEPEPEPEPIPEPEPEPYQEPPVISVTFPLELNAASYEQLVFIPGVGDVTAQRITQYRDHLGGSYARMSQLMDIKGIGAETYKKITAYLYLDVQEEESYDANDGEDLFDYEDDSTDLEGQE